MALYFTLTNCVAETDLDHMQNKSARVRETLRKSAREVQWFLRHNFYAASCVPMQSEGRKIVHCSRFYLLISFKSISGSVSNVSPKKLSDGGENQNSGKCQ